MMEANLPRAARSDKEGEIILIEPHRSPLSSNQPTRVTHTRVPPTEIVAKLRLSQISHIHTLSSQVIDCQ